MSVSNKIHVVPISRVTTLLDHTDVSVRWDLLQTLGLRIKMIQFVLVRNSTYSKPQSLVPLLLSASPQVSAQIVDIVHYGIIELHRKKLAELLSISAKESLVHAFVGFF